MSFGAAPAHSPLRTRTPTSCDQDLTNDYDCPAIFFGNVHYLSYSKSRPHLRNLLTLRPVARVQKIINADPERLNVSKNAAFAIALATEMFIQHLATTTHNVVKTERKPRRNIQYRDVSSAIAKTDNLEFAVDVVPKTILWKEAKKKREEREEREKGKEKEKEVNGKGKGKGKATENGDTNGHAINVEEVEEIEEEEEVVPNSATPSPTTTPAAATAKPAPDDAMDIDTQPERVEESDPEEDAAAMQLEMEMRGPPRPKTKSPEAKSVPAPAPSPKVNTRRSAGGFTSINGTK
jgi:DNA polymerase epsilon subunit 4